MAGEARAGVGAAPHQWLIGRRLEETKKLLECAELSMTDVAVLSGFRDAGHMTDIFRRHEGGKPGEWRLAQRRQRALARVIADAHWT